jgi:serine/threonine protein kinase
MRHSSVVLSDPPVRSPSPPHQPHSVCPNKIGSYLLQDVIGEGAFAMVRVAIHEETHKTYACKIIPKKLLLAAGLGDQFDRETDIVRSLSHPNLCQLYDIFSDTINNYVIMELCQSGTLKERLFQDGRFPESAAKVIFKQLIDVLVYIHSTGIAHRDLKLENLLIDNDNRIKLIDFGLSAYQSEDGLFGTHVGSTTCAAPECWGSERYDGFKLDSWSCGVILYTILAGQLPWSILSEQKMVDDILHAQYVVPSSWSPQAADLIQKTLKLDPNERLSIDEMQRHPWIEGVAVPSVSLPLLGGPGKIGFSRAHSLMPGGAIGRSQSARLSSGTIALLIQKGKMARNEKADDEKFRRAPMAFGRRPCSFSPG